MSVALTGATGLVGSAVLRALLAAGHEVTALVRSDASAETVRAAGARPVVGDLTDPSWLQQQFAATEGAIHTASPGDATSADFDRGVAQAAVAAYAGTGKRYVHTGGVWVFGTGTGITEDSPFDAPALTAWRAEVERTLLDADVSAAVVAPGIVYSGRAGLPGLLATPAEDGSYHLIGDGSQHWTTVGADELGDLYVRVYASDVTGYVLGVNDEAVTVRQVVEALAGDARIVGETPDETRARLGGPLADALLLDQQADNGRARQLGWTPTDASILDAVRG